MSLNIKFVKLAQLQYDIFRGIKTDEKYSYFARAIRGGQGAIRGGRENLPNDRIIVGEIQIYSIVPPEHVVWDDVDGYEKFWKELHPDINIPEREDAVLKKSQKFVADLTIPSLGTDVLTGKAVKYDIEGLLFCREDVKDDPKVQHILHESKMSYAYYNDGNIREIAKKEIAELFNQK